MEQSSTLKSMGATHVRAAVPRVTVRDLLLAVVARLVLGLCRDAGLLLLELELQQLRLLQIRRRCWHVCLLRCQRCPCEPAVCVLLDLDCRVVLSLALLKVVLDLLLERCVARALLLVLWRDSERDAQR